VWRSGCITGLKARLGKIQQPVYHQRAKLALTFSDLPLSTFSFLSAQTWYGKLKEINTDATQNSSVYTRSLSVSLLNTAQDFSGPSRTQNERKLESKAQLKQNCIKTFPLTVFSDTENISISSYTKIADAVLFCSRINFLKRTKLLKQLCQNPVLQPKTAASSMSSQSILESKKHCAKAGIIPKSFSKTMHFRASLL